MARRRGNTDAFSLFSFQDIITSVTGIMILVTLLFSLELTRERAQPTDITTQEPEKLVPSVGDLEKQLDTLQDVFQENQSLLQRIAAMPAVEVSQLEKTLRERLASLESFSHEIAAANSSLESDANQTISIEKRKKDTLKSLEEELNRLQQEIATTSKSSVVVYNPDPAATKSAWLVDLGNEKIQVFSIEGGGTRTFPVKAQGSVPTDFIGWVRQRDNSQEYFVLLLRPESLALYDKLQPTLEGMGFDLGFDLIDDDTNAQSDLSVK